MTDLKVLKAFPPNYARICAAIPAVKTWRTVFFCYGECIYNPYGMRISRFDQAHERIHSDRQKAHAGGVEGWWNQYLADTKFRFIEELVAHRAEFQAALELWGPTGGRLLQGHLDKVVKRLSGQLYGGLVSPAHARMMILSETEPQIISRSDVPDGVPVLAAGH